MIGLQDLFNKTALFKRAIEDKNDYGDVDQLWETIYTVSCGLMQKSKTENMGMQRVSDVGLFRLYCFPIEITESDRVTVDDIEYRITAVNDVMGYHKLMQVDLEVIDGLREQNT